MGNVIQAGSKMNPARQAAIEGGVPVSVPAMTVNRVCGSGAQAIVISDPPDFSGHGAAYDSAFGRKYGACIKNFIEQGTRQAPCI